MTKLLADLLPESYDRLVEPMVGGGALFFATRPKQAILGDSNEELINFYHVLANRTEALIDQLLQLRASSSQYYKFRSARPRAKMERAVRFAYLNRLCWNGLYRVNGSGEFNVPFGGRLPKRLWNEEHLQTAATLLRNATLLSADFQATLKYCRAGDVVYLDPPYPKRRENGHGFNRYTRTPFTAADHERLACEALRLHDKGIRVVISTAASHTFLSLFPRGFRVHRVRSSSLISCNGATRGNASEAILLNYK